MIRIHEFNSKWWGSPIGIVTEPAFFALASDRQRELLKPYQWAEYRAAPGEHPPLQTICRAGFFHVDTQIYFKLAMDKLESTPGLDSLTVRFADESPFAVDADEIRSFASERFVSLPGATATRVDSRYVLWSKQLVSESPEWCMQVLEGGELQGWYFGRMTGDGLNLILAMLRRDARIRGQALYRKAMIEYARRGATTGWAGYSASNIPVMNILGSLGARYTGYEDFWLWIGNCDASK